MLTHKICAATLLAIASAAAALAQPPAPTFQQYPAPAKFSGKPAPPAIRTAEDRSFRTRIREAAAQGPNFAGHYTVAEWGCGAGCVSVVVVDAATGTIYRGPFRNLGWEMRKYEGKYASNGDRFEPLAYRLDSRLLIARGCPEETACASYFWEWAGAEFKLVRKIPSAPLADAAK
jgi:hypothetical protein